MNTLKKISALLLMATLLVCVTVAFASCSIGEGEVTHCPEDCECREDDVPSDEHCPADCECRGGDAATAAKVTYVVVIRDDLGNIVPGVTAKITDGESFVEKTTTADGYLTFPLVQGTWNVQITNAPYGYKYDPATKYEFDAQGVCAIELDKLVGYTFIAKSPYDDSVIKDVYVELFAWNEESGDYDDMPAASGITDADGKVLVEVLTGKYMASFTVDGARYTEPVYIEAPSNEYDVPVYDNPGTTANAPEYIEDNSVTMYGAEKNVTYWYGVRMANNRKLVINNANVVVYHNDTTYTADKKGVVEVPLVDDGFGVVFGISYVPAAEDADDYATITFDLVAPIGTRDNPVELEKITDLDVVPVKASVEHNAIYYSWTPTFDGRLYLLCDNANNIISISNGSIKTDEIEGAAISQIDFVAGATIIISVGASETEMATLGEGDNAIQYEDTTYIAAEIDIDPVVYAKYTVEAYDAYFNLLVGTVVTASDADGNVLATALTDVAGKAEFYLPADGAYTITADVPGYSVGEFVTEPGVYSGFLSAAPYNFAMLPTMRGMYMVEIPAGVTNYYMLRVNNNTKLTLMDFDGNATLNFGRFPIVANPNGEIIAELSPTAADPMTGFVYFSITNADADNAITLMGILQDMTPGVSFDNRVVIEAAGDYTANFDASVYSQGAVFYTYTATEAGTFKLTTNTLGAGVVVNNVTTSQYGDYTSVEDAAVPAVVEVTVAAGDVLQFELGPATFGVAALEINFNITFTPATAG